MSGYIQVSVVGGRKALIDVGTHCGVICSPDMELWDVATPAKPLGILFRGASDTDGRIDIYGMSAAEFLSLCDEIKSRSKSGPATTIILSDDYQAETARVQFGWDVRIRYAHPVEPVNAP